jgi:Metallo-beta-lactamase superfamily
MSRKMKKQSLHEKRIAREHLPMPPARPNDEFVALPVGQGDAFFLRRGELTALIDGGISRGRFCELFRMTLRRNDVNVLVCTHNDADHANGIIGFLEGGLACDEIWLPGLWGDRLTDLLNTPAEFVKELGGDIGRQTESTLQQIADELGEVPTQEASQAAPEHGEFLELEQDPDRADNDLWPHGPVNPLRAYYVYGPLMIEAIQAAKRIRAIAIAVANRGLPIRWFRYSNTDAGGGKDQLRPLNAIEVARSRRELRPKVGDGMKG